MTPIPLLFIGDSPDIKSGLARIGRDLACLVSAKIPEFRVGYLGLGGIGSTRLPFSQYIIKDESQWGLRELESAWNDLSRGKPGAIFTVWDATRLTWLARPTPELGDYYPFLSSGKFAKWGYFPIDAEGPHGRLSALGAHAVGGYDRVLAYGIFGATVLQATLGREVEWIPHGFNMDTFRPRGKTESRMAMRLPEDRIVVGCNMTNQARKNWGIVFPIMAALREIYPDIILWAHCDVDERHWSLPALLADFNLRGNFVRTTCGEFNDTQLSYYYSGCDITILPSLGEGFGFPIVESMACGVPVIHGKYAGGVELIPYDKWLVEPRAWRMEGLHNQIRPVYDVMDWRVACEHAIEEEKRPEEYRAAVEHLDWGRLWPATWEKWFRGGIK